jgi:hypothetical protein
VSTLLDNAEIIERLARIETRLDLTLAKLDNSHLDHETRIRALEKKVWTAAGFAAAIGGTVGAFAQTLLGG